MMRRTRDPGPSGRSCKQERPLNDFAGSLLDCLSTNSAILDEKGIIRITNRAWRVFGRIKNMKYPDAVGLNYLEVTESATGYSSERAYEAATGIRSLLQGGVDEFVIEYPCHEEDRERWCRLRAAPLEGFGALRAVLSHEDITAERCASGTLSALQRELANQKANLEAVNTALNVLLKRREDDKKDLEAKVLSNVRELVNPYMEKLRNTNLDATQREYLAIIRANIEGVTAPFVHHLSSKSFNLTSREIGVANLILEGRGTKEIADVLCISPNAVEFHRKNIRRKLGIRNKSVNLRSRLLSLEPNCLYQQFHAWNRCRKDLDDQ